MGGLIFFFLLFIWVGIAIFIASVAYKILPKKWWGLVFTFIFFLVLLPLPVFDDLMGSFEFRRLCKELPLIQFDPVKARGRTVYTDDTRTKIDSKWIPFVVHEWRYLDVNTDELILSYSEIHSQGGWLMTKYKFNDSSTSVSFFMNEQCENNTGLNVNKIFKEFDITWVYRPKNNGKKTK